MLVHMSISGAIGIICIISLRFLAIHRFPKRLFVFLWCIMLFRLLMPFDLPVSYGVAVPTADLAVSGTDCFEIIWFFVLLLLIVILGLLYGREYRQLREAIPMEGKEADRLRKLAGIPEKTEILVSDRIFTPLTFGIFAPKIVLPSILPNQTDEVWRCILLHEMVHIRRRDNALKIMILTAAVIHWFNPFVWIMCMLFNRDIELSCDEKVLALLGEGHRKQYAVTLIALAEKQYQWSLCSHGFGENPIKERIEAIVRYKKRRGIGMIGAIMIVGTTIAVFAQSPSGMTDKLQAPAAGTVQEESAIEDEINGGYRAVSPDFDEETGIKERKEEMNGGNSRIKVVEE